MSDFLLGYCVGIAVAWVSMIVGCIIAAITIKLRIMKNDY